MEHSDAFGEVVNLAIPVAGFVLASRRPANRVGWLFLVAGLALGLSAFSQQYGLHALIVAPGSLPAGWAFVWLSNWTWVIAFAMLARDDIGAGTRDESHRELAATAGRLVETLLDHAGDAAR